MARVNKGNSLGSPILQPGWTIEDDGYGFLSCSASYKVSHGTSTGTPATGVQALDATPKRGTPFPRDARLTCHRASSVLDGNGIQVISVDYVGIAKGTTTLPNVSGRFSSNQEPISTHPRFKDFGGTKPAPLNGAAFNDDGSFKRFADPGYDEFYGVTSYLVCGFGITGVIYTSDYAVVGKLKDAIGSTSSTGSFNGTDLVGQLGFLGNGSTAATGWGNGAWQSSRETDQLLFSGMALEYFGNLIKISYDIMFSQDGWNGSIYNNRGDVAAKSKDSKATSWKGSNVPKTLGSQAWKGSGNL